jgi:hypothetical protein
MTWNLSPVMRRVFLGIPCILSLLEISINGIPFLVILLAWALGLVALADYLWEKNAKPLALAALSAMPLLIGVSIDEVMNILR